MSDSKGFGTTRIDTSFGVLIVVTHSGGVRAGQTFSQEGSSGKTEWYAQCVDWYGPNMRPVSQRVPPEGGLASLDELERVMVQDVAGLMKTDYWRER